ncbi:DNA methyltransferase [Desulfopila sp. IMCC35008]|uniref:DNA methyltransferase n=1 Tax=Desulfopila sp. IMCC35008 TaxID=2653858 RepID=UPI0013D43FC7|nr:DNA methyltransferase [Desulfopila sp. IMCC35008]
MKSGKSERTNKKNDKITLNSSYKILYEKPMPSTRTGPLYNAFSYPTKISPEAIAIFIATHTKPGATILDTFAGSGTTGLATLLCDKPTAAMKKIAQEIGINPKWGARKAVLYELGGLGSFVSKTMCNSPCPKEFKKATEDLLDMAQKEIGWVYETKDPEGNKGTMRHAIWADVLLCQKCGAEINYWDAVVRRAPLHLVDQFKCTSCKKTVMVNDCDRQTEKGRDKILGRNVVSKKRVLARVYGRTNTTTWQREPTEQDIALVERVLRSPIPAYAPKHKIVWGDLYRSGYHTGITHLHHFYTRRNFLVMTTLWHLIEFFPEHLQDALRLLVLSYNSTHSTLMTRVVVKNGENDFVLTGAQSGVLYVSGLPVEKNILLGVKRKAGPIMKAFELVSGSQSKVEVCNASSTKLHIPAESIDYVFTDPPFGDFIPYAEINQLNELWLGNVTNRSNEIIVSNVQGKDIDSYGQLMGSVFKEIARVMKQEGKTTVVFHSAKAAIWRALSLAYTTAGLNVEATSVLDKIQASFKQIVSTVSVKGDPLLLLSKTPNGNLISEIQTSEQAFLEVKERARLENNLHEREPERLYSRYAARCLEMGICVSLSAGEFYKKIKKEGFKK